VSNDFGYVLGVEAEIMCSGEIGRVVGMARFEGGENQYFLRYRNGAGCAVEDWWKASAIRPHSPTP